MKADKEIANYRRMRTLATNGSTVIALLLQSYLHEAASILFEQPTWYLKEIRARGEDFSPRKLPVAALDSKWLENAKRSTS